MEISKPVSESSRSPALHRRPVLRYVLRTGTVALGMHNEVYKRIEMSIRHFRIFLQVACDVERGGGIAPLVRANLDEVEERGYSCSAYVEIFLKIVGVFR